MPLATRTVPQSNPTFPLQTKQITPIRNPFALFTGANGIFGARFDAHLT
jgi:hypothetical protein